MPTHETASPSPSGKEAAAQVKKNRPIFISYRRGDATYATNAIDNALCRYLNKSDVFLDTSSIDPGQKWPDHIRDRLEAAEVLIVVITERWHEAASEAGGRRLEKEGDWVRLEIETALSSGKTIIPLLMGEAREPEMNALPPSMQGLCAHKYHRLRTDHFDHDFGLVISNMGFSITIPEEVRIARFGPGAVDGLCSLLTKLPPNEWLKLVPECFNFDEGTAREVFLTAACIFMTKCFPDISDSSPDRFCAVVRRLAVSMDALDLPALVQRILWSLGKTSAKHAAKIQDWLKAALAVCQADSERLESHMVGMGLIWQKRQKNPPLPTLEIDCSQITDRRGQFAGSASMRWGPYTRPVLEDSIVGPFELVVTEVYNKVANHPQWRFWPFERVNVYVDKDQLNFPWERYRHRDGEIQLLPWPVVLRLRRDALERQRLAAPPSKVSRAQVALALGAALEFQPPLDKSRPFFASWSAAEDQHWLTLHRAAARTGLGLWTRSSYDATFCTTLLDRIDHQQRQQLPAVIHRERTKAWDQWEMRVHRQPGECAPTTPWAEVALLYDDRTLPGIDFPSPSAANQSRLETILQLHKNFA